ncbi:MAG TPA: GPW/gp25 family protein [Actinomycetota bacterium]|nr:GPW/gp25 family protein [Actinomycetota bacterium]
MGEDFVGAGWAFPVRTGATGGVALVRRDQEIAEAIRLILGTAYGERPMRPEFGCAIHDYVFASVTGSTAGRIAYEVQRSLDRWEPRINVGGIDVTFDPADASTIYIDISYVIRGTNDPRNLVFPFYVIPAEA